MKKFDIDLGTVAYGFLAMSFWVAILFLKMFDPGNPIFIDDKEEALKEVDQVCEFIDNEVENWKVDRKALLVLLLETKKNLRRVFYNREIPATENQLLRKKDFEHKRYFDLGYEIRNRVRIG